ncbi:MAG: glutathione S-transferase family protein [Hyphomonadaceae bacterium]|nr:glutathione S-transferase family protein [Hyphomonadaceae bacterium]
MPQREITKLTLYGNTESGNCLKPRWIAELLGIDYDWVEVDIFAGATSAEEFLQLNPAGQVPLARWPDGRVLPQSNAIMLYLAETEDSLLVPKDTFKRAQMMSWLFWEQYSHEPYIAVRRSNLRFRDMAEADLDPALLSKGRRALGIMEMQLTYTDWLVGDVMTLADIALVAYTRVAHEGGFDLSDFPSVERWISRTESALGLPHANPAEGAAL